MAPSKDELHFWMLLSLFILSLVLVLIAGGPAIKVIRHNQTFDCEKAGQRLRCDCSVEKPSNGN